MLVSNHKKLRDTFDKVEEDILYNVSSPKKIKRILRELYETTMTLIVTDEREIESIKRAEDK